MAFASYGAAVLVPKGNGFIAVFVSAIVLGIRRPDIRECFERRSEELIEVVKLAIFVVFGALLSFSGLFHDGWAAVAIVVITLLVIGPLAIFVSLAGASLSVQAQGVHGLVRAQGRGDDGVLAARARQERSTQAPRIFNIAALAVFTSIIAHGLTDHPGAEWMARVAEREAAGSADERRQ